MNKPMVIFVDDSETALASTRMIVQTMEIEYKQYLKATDALEEIRSGKIFPNLIITDMNMPIMNGIEFLVELRKTEITRTTPVLMLTTETNDTLKQQGKSLSLTGWIVKPFNHAQLKMAIGRVLRLPS
jgi:two-component system, chemotaxis family, chemotaxis protein CheY